jgi:hypothetical protein
MFTHESLEMRKRSCSITSRLLELYDRQQGIIRIV